jgi:hypothetical protein
MPSITPARAAAYALLAFAACPPPATAHGQAVTAQAGGSAEIVGGAVSAGVSFDVATRLLTSIFVTGRTGDTVSIFAPTAAATPIGQNAWHEAMGISSSQLAALGDITILSRGAVSINVQQIRKSSDQAPDDPDAGVFVVLAQFN